MNSFYDDYYLFCKIAEHGSIKKASDQLGLPTSTLSRRLANLEKTLTVKLIDRNAFSNQLTVSGEQYFQSLAPVFESLDYELEQRRKDISDISGKIRLSASNSVYQQFLVEHLSEFIAIYPDIELDITTEGLVEKELNSKVDIAVLVGELPSKYFVARKLTEEKQCIVAKGDVDISEIKKPRDLTTHKIVSTQVAVPPVYYDHDLRSLMSLDYKPFITVSDLNMVKYTVLHTNYIGILPEYMAKQEIEAGQLKRVLPDVFNEKIPYYLAYRKKADIPRREKALINFMFDKFG